MVQRVYATLADYQQWSGDAVTTPARVQQLLNLASGDVDSAMVASVYQTDPNGYPTDGFTIEAFRDATCAQVAWLVDQDDDTGVKQRLQSVSVGGLSFQRAAGTAGSALPVLCPRALQILRQHGALPNAPLVGW